MKLILGLGLVAAFLSYGALAAETQEIVHCTSPLMGAPVFSVDYIPPTDQKLGHYLLKKDFLVPRARPLVVEASAQEVVHYGSSFILTVNRGGAGYAHLYAHGNVTVIDVELSLPPAIGTSGALTNYKCKLVPPRSSPEARRL